MYVCVTLACLIPTEVRKGCWVCWNWSYGWSWATTWVLAMEPGPSARILSAFNCWPISSAPYVSFRHLRFIVFHIKLLVFAHKETFMQLSFHHRPDWICSSLWMLANVCFISGIMRALVIVIVFFFLSWLFFPPQIFVERMQIIYPSFAYAICQVNLREINPNGYGLEQC